MKSFFFRTSPISGKEFVDRVTKWKDGMRATAMIQVMLLVVDAEMAVHGGKHVLRADGAFLGFRSLGIGFTHNAATLDTSP